MKQITILQLVGTMDRGGVETFLMNVLRTIDTKKYRLVFLCFSDKTYDFESEIIALGGTIVRTPDVKLVGSVAHIKNLMHIIRQHGVNIVHIHTYFNSMFGLLAAKLAGVKVRITHSHNTQSEEFPSLLKRVYFAISKCIINTLSTHYFACGQSAGQALFYKRNTFTVINNGIILDDYAYKPAVRDQVKKELGITNNQTVILHVGRFDRQKNHDFLIDIYNEYVQLNPDSVLVLAGDGGLKKDIQSKVQGLGIQKNILFIGKRNDIDRLYNIADLFLFPSLFEGLPVTLVEAQANGLVSLVSNTIDATAKFTGCVHFHPLHSSAKQWAKHITQLNLQRIDTTAALKKGPYDIVQNAKNIESLYARMLGKDA